MRFDFATILVALTALTGVIWLIDGLFFAKQRGEKKEPLVVDYARSFFPVILIVLIIRSFLAEPFRIPSGSMEPTLYDGDLILVNKFSYGLRLPVLNNKFIEIGEPQRGDVVVFRLPRGDKAGTDYIKRIIGLPGDRIEYREEVDLRTRRINKEVWINGERAPIEWQPLNSAVNEPLKGTETLGEVEHGVQLLLERSRRGTRARSWVVEPGSYFVMGDNRDNSQDSRMWGLVPEENLVGKAFLIWMRLKLSDWDRIGTIIK